MFIMWMVISLSSLYVRIPVKCVLLSLISITTKHVSHFHKTARQDGCSKWYWN